MILVGPAGSGKDTVAGFIVENHGAVAIAQADPMKRLAAYLFGFTDEQLWGPSQCRNAEDLRYPGRDMENQDHPSQSQMKPWDNAWERLGGSNANDAIVTSWLESLFPGDDFDAFNVRYKALRSWMGAVQKQTFWAGKALTPRLVLQTLGTEWGRAQGRDVWSNFTISAAMKLLGGGHRYSRTEGLVVDDKARAPNFVVVTDGRFRNEVVNVLRVGGAAVRIDSPNTNSAAIEAAGVKGHASEAEQKEIPGHLFSALIVNQKENGLKACEALVGRVMNFLFSPAVAAFTTVDTKS